MEVWAAEGELKTRWSLVVQRAADSIQILRCMKMTLSDSPRKKRNIRNQNSSVLQEPDVEQDENRTRTEPEQNQNRTRHGAEPEQTQTWSRVLGGTADLQLNRIPDQTVSSRGFCHSSLMQSD
ncbi:uncharacterized protein V6R79_003929 [Siganus canaliculatus]